MGHGCSQCGEKISGGVTSTKCSCIECYCEVCWEELFEPKFEIETETLYKDDKGEFKKVTKTYFYQVENESVTCPECGEEWNLFEVRDY